MGQRLCVWGEAVEKFKFTRGREPAKLVGVWRGQRQEGNGGARKKGGEMGMSCGRLRRGGKATGLGGGRRQAEFTHPCQSIY